MKKLAYKTIDPLLGVALVIIYFFTKNEYLPAVIYTLFACAMAIYIFPFRALNRNRGNQGSKWEIVNKLSYPVISAVIGISVWMLFITDVSPAIDATRGIIGIANGLLIWIHYFTGSGKYYVVMHFTYAFLVAATILS